MEKLSSFNADFNMIMCIKHFSFRHIILTLLAFITFIKKIIEEQNQIMVAIIKYITTVIYLYVSECKINKMKFDLDTYKYKINTNKPYYIFAILCNLLDNAIEAEQLKSQIKNK